MDTANILNELRAGKDRIQKAIDALEVLDLTATPITHSAQQPQVAPTGKGKRTMSAAARRKISEAAKRRWAQQSKNAKPQGSEKHAVPKPVSAKRAKGGLTAAGRKRLSENMKKRWAERKKSAAKA